MTTANEFDLNGLPIFVALVEAGSFTKAAERLGCTKTRVSLQIRQLETRLGVTLFLRTTRRVQLTQAGEALYHQCHPLLIDLQGGACQCRERHPTAARRVAYHGARRLCRRGVERRGSGV